MNRRIMVLTLALLISLQTLSASIPTQINYQGYLTSPGGSPLDTVVAMTFKLYDGSSGGTQLWTETQPSCTVRTGLFNASLGSVTALPDSFNRAQVWLGVTVGDNTEMVPRSRLVSVPYAYRTGTIDDASGGTVNGNVMVTGKANIGSGNVNSGSYAFVAGESDSAAGSHSTVGGGYQNAALASYTTISGGRGNKALVSYGTIAGGYRNTVTDDYGFVGSGTNNIADFEAAVLSGDSNSATGSYSIVGSGNRNIASGSYGVIVGGDGNEVLSTFGTIVGGDHNYLTGSSSFIGGGYQNSVSENYAVVGGGDENHGDGLYGTIGGGQYNSVSDTAATVGGGEQNTAGGRYSVVGGGDSNTADSTYCVVGGGFANYATGRVATICGGMNNHADNTGSTVGGGAIHHASGAYSTVSGGYFNHANGTNATIGGGYYNVAEANATVGGGCHNKARGEYAVICGGGGSNPLDSNQAVGDYSMIPGGRRNYALGNYSFAAGRRAQAQNLGSFVWADATDEDFSDSASYQFRVRARGGVWFITDNSPWTGAKLPAGSSAWTSVSDSTQKRNSRLVDTKDVLNKVTQLPIKQWSYKSQAPSIEHIGPMAQDFWTQFHIGDDSLSISTIDPSGIALAAIQELAKENAKLQTSNIKLEERINQLEKQLQLLVETKSSSSQQIVLNKK